MTNSESQREPLPLGEDTLRRLLVSRQMLAAAVGPFTSHSDAVAVSRAILSAHDAAELALAAICSALDALPKDNRDRYLLEYADALQASRPDVSFPERRYLVQLNRVRKNFKHGGELPHVPTWYSVADRITRCIADWCDLYLRADFSALDFSDLMTNAEVRSLYAEAKRAEAAGDYKAALEWIARALVKLLHGFQGILFPTVGTPNTDEALRLAVFGVSASEYLTLQKLLPKARLDLLAEGWPVIVEWEEREYGHPANRTAWNVQFCSATFVDMALKIQHAPAVPMPLHFRWIYDDVITPKTGGVGLWQYEYEGATLLGRTPRRGPVVYTLRPGERLRCHLAPSQVEPVVTLSDVMRTQSIKTATVLEVRSKDLPGETAYVDAPLVDIDFMVKDDPQAQRLLRAAHETTRPDVAQRGEGQ